MAVFSQSHDLMRLMRPAALHSADTGLLNIHSQVLLHKLLMRLDLSLKLSHSNGSEDLGARRPYNLYPQNSLNHLVLMIF